MATMDLQEAARFLRMNPEALRQKAKAGKIPGAKIGKCWIFLTGDLVEHIRSQYACERQAVRVTDLKEARQCHSIVEGRPGGSASRHQTDVEYANLLGLKTG